MKVINKPVCEERNVDLPRVYVQVLEICGYSIVCGPEGTPSWRNLLQMMAGCSQIAGVLPTTALFPWQHHLLMKRL